MKPLMTIDNMPQIECPSEGDNRTRVAQPRRRNNAKKRKFSYEQYSLEGKLIRFWKSSVDIEEYGEGVDGKPLKPSCVTKVCNGDRKTHGGYKWKKIPYVHEEE